MLDDYAFTNILSNMLTLECDKMKNKLWTTDYYNNMAMNIWTLLLSSHPLMSSHRYCYAMLGASLRLYKQEGEDEGGKVDGMTMIYNKYD